MSVFEAAELDAIALLADTWDNDLDPEVSAQPVQANAQAYLSAGKEEGGTFPVRPSHLPLEDRRRRLKELKQKPNAVLAVEEDTGRTTTDVRCLH